MIRHDYGQSKNVFWQKPLVSRKDREGLLGNRSALLWFTGLSGSGKSTIAHAVELELSRLGKLTFVLDGDNIRHGLCRDLGFSPEAREENIRRIGEVTRLFLDAGMITLTAFISPLKSHRLRVRELVGPEDFIEIYCDCSIDECERRDVKGLYRKAKAGEIADFTGISSPYEAPETPDLVLRTDQKTVEESVREVLFLLEERGVINCPPATANPVGR